VRGHAVADTLECDTLDLRVDRQLHVAAVHRLDALAGVLDHAPQTVAHDVARSLAPFQRVLERELDAFLPALVNVGEPDHVGGRRAFGVDAAVAALEQYAGQLERLDLLGGGFVDLPIEPDEVRVVVELARQFAQRHGEHLGELAAVLTIRVEVLRRDRDLRREHAAGEQLAVAVEDAAAAGRHVEAHRIAKLALLEIEVRADDLHEYRAAGQHGETHPHQRDEQLGSPRRCRLREQRACRIAHAACAGSAARRCLALRRNPQPLRDPTHHRAPSVAGTALGSSTYCVTVAVALRMRSRSRAIFSTRRCVACAWRSPSSRCRSSASLRSSRWARSSSV
jgi:hypothetical protein